MGLEGAPLVDAGEFRVVDCEARGAPDTISINALAAPQTPATKTQLSRAFDNTTLRDIVHALGGELDLEIVGNVAPLELIRITQNGETNLALLRRLARDYGYAFSIRPPQLIFYDLAQLSSADPVLRFSRSDLLSGWNLKGGPQDTYVACDLTWFDALTKQTRVTRVTVEHARQRLTIAPATTDGLELPTRTLRRGDRGDDVKNWQTFLARLGLYTIQLDGIFGTQTDRGTRQFQTQSSIAIDGVVGPETRRAAVEAGYLGTTAGIRSEPSGRILKVEARVESAAQAEARALAELNRANRLRVTGELPLKVGDRRALAGATVELSADFGRFGGRYLVQSSKHTVSRSGGYTTRGEVTFV